MKKTKPLLKSGKSKTEKLSPKKSNTASKSRSRSKAVSRKTKTVSKKKATSPSRPVKKKNSRPDKESILETRLRYEKALAACAHELLANPKSSRQPLQNSIKHLLQAAQVSRVYIFENFNDLEDGLCIRQTYEAVTQGIKPEIDNPDLQHLPFIGAGFERWAKRLSKGNHLGGQVSKFPKSERDILEPQDILSILVLPIFVDHRWYGFIGFDDCINIRDWSEDDIRMLRTASEIIGGYLSHQRVQEILRDTQARLEIRLKEQRDNLKSAHQDLNQEVVKRKRSGKALEESEERFRQLAEHVKEILWFTSIDGKKVIYVSPAFETIFGNKVEALYENPTLWAEAIHPDDKSHILGAFTRENLVEGRFNVEFRIIRTDGSIRWIKTRGFPIKNSSGKIYRIAGIASDITEEKEMENQLMESEGRFRSLADQATDAFYVHDLEGKLLEVNPKACESLGYTREELLTMSVSDIESNMNPGDILEGLNNMRPGESITFEGVHRRRNKTTFPVEVHAGPILWEGNNYLLATVRDITKRKQVEHELLKTKEAAEKASMAKSEFLSRVSHELRTPLNAILGFGQLLESYSNRPLSNTQKTQVREILGAGHHLLELINDVLDLSHIESGKLALTIEAVPLKDLLEETQGLVETMAKDQSVSLHSELTGLENLMVSGDRTRLKQVFLNLFTNAIKFNQENGSVKIGVEDIKENQVIIFVEDTGLGIPADKREIIFEPFQRLEAGPSPVQGTGMGLSIVKNLLGMMDGHIRVGSGPEGGSRFMVALTPLVETEDPVVEAKFFPEGGNVSSQKGQAFKVLYVEDNLSNMRLVQQILENRPHIDLLSADHPRTGILLARNEQPDLILLDINLPEMDGFSVLKLLQGFEETRDIPVIALSAHAMQEDIDKALSLGFLKYISKPIEVDVLLSHIDSALASNSQ